MTVFTKILIANRGEIACRIIKSAREMGIATVAVYSDADVDTLHVKMADEAVHIGPAPSTESYLVIDSIVKACIDSGAQAVHPGFGFLSENAEFARELERNNIAFIGPGVRAIEVMGDKIESKKLAAAAGVSTVPGHPDALTDSDHAHEIASTIGCPVMLKASAGGGGKGMRVAWTLDEVRDNFTSARNEARSAFGDDRVFVEKFIEQPRHIEIQVLADKQGNCISLGERECSIQRRHQKVLEEAPSPFIDQKTRESMGQQAVQLANAVDYCSAGTVEFIVDKDRNFYFLEMNTRLQVEHPVTEFVTGLDLVEQMINIAADKPLPLKQTDVEMRGWSIEARVYAEDPDRNFMPSIGRLTRYQPPEESDNVRVDTGVYEGGEISMYYDPMIAKLVSYGKNRSEAIETMRSALDSYVIRGVNHNIPFLAALVDHPEFKAGNLTTGFIDDHYPEGFDSTRANPANLSTALLMAVFCHHLKTTRAAGISGQLVKSANDRGPENTYVAIAATEEHSLTVSGTTDRNSSKHSTENGITLNVEFDGRKFTLESDWQPSRKLMRCLIDGEESVGQIDMLQNSIVVTRSGQALNVQLLLPRIAELKRLMPVKKAPDMSRFLLSPMPGLLIKISVNLGDSIKAGQELAVVEAMKMENVLVAANDAVVKAIPNATGDSLSVDDVIIEFE